MMKKPYLLLAAALWIVACGESPKAPPPAASAAPVPVSAVPVASEAWPTEYEATGTVRSLATGTVSARMSGYVHEVKAQVGDRVREGQSLVTLDARDLDVASKRAEAARDEVRAAMPEAETAITAAKANLDLAQTTFNRMRELFDKKSISNQEFDEASARLKAATATQEMARARRAQLDSRLATVEQEVKAAAIARTFADVSAPFAGVVVTRSVEPGNLATPGTPLLTIEREGAYRLEALVEESKSSLIHAGQPVTVTLDGIDHPIDARVTEFVPAIDAASRAYTVKINLPALANVRSGLFGRAQFQLGNRTLLAVPVAAIIEHGQLQSVYVIENGLARARLITTGEKSKDRVEILSGLTAGDKLILPVPTGLADGAPVESRQ